MRIGKDFVPYPASIIAVSMLLFFGASGARASAVTYIVGTCTSGTQFKTIQSALNASPAPTTVEVCPGQYYEQLVITKPVTLEGIEAGNGTLAQIMLPSNPTAANITFEAAPETVVVQINVIHVTGGTVNLSNLQVNGMGFSSSNATLIAVAYQQSSGTVNHLATSSQDGLSMGVLNVGGFGMWIVGGSSNPTVIVESSSFNAFTHTGILASSDADTSSPQLKLTIENNVFSVLEGEIGIDIEEAADATVSGNIIDASGNVVIDANPVGIISNSTSGAVTGNTIIGSQVGIFLGTDGASVTSNNIFDTTQTGIFVGTGLSVSKVTNNSIRTVKTPLEQDSTGTAIELNCNNVSSSQVNSNLMMDAWFGYADAPAGFAGSNTYVGLYTDVGTCSSKPNVRSQANAALREKLLRQLPEHQG